ncbi:MAG: T9SS type A sorting domain-containing protein [Lentimicrobiaceae bacterium]|nr:T9SS type A sorting domain-containing protein [Lentimicrobiaceae bacterium]
MKKFTLLLTLVMSVLIASSQSQRFVVLEHFTNASCGPCAAYNPTLANLLNNNTSKCISIQYHTSWPGVDPMNAHNPADVSARVGFYGVQGVPHVVMDGNAFSGSPAYVNQTMINNRYAVPADFDITINQELNQAQDSIFITMLGVATKNVSGNLVAHCAVIEKLIQFTTAPGYNGEKVFHNVMKKMLPTSSGTALPDNMSVGDYFIVRAAWKLENVYQINQLSVVGFVQNKTDKAVLQAAKTSTDPITAPFQHDVEVSDLSGINTKYCNPSINPTFKLRNNGSETVTSVVFEYKINGEVIGTYDYATSLEFLDETTVTFPVENFEILNNNTLEIAVQSVNNVADQYVKNNNLEGSFEKAPNATGTEIKITLRTDSKPEETSWTITDNNGNIVATGENYTIPNKTYVENVTLEANKCYSLMVYDTGNNGLCCDNGTGYLIVANASGGTIGNASKFGDKLEIQFSTYDHTDIETNYASKVSIYPNPTKNMVYINLDNNFGRADYQLINTQGKVLKKGTFENNNGSVDCSDVQQGIYFLKINIANKQTIVEKISVVK